MTQDEYLSLSKQCGSLIKYMQRHYDVIDYFCHYPREECGYCVPRGVVVACDAVTLAKLQDHAKRYYPGMTVIPMTVAECISHMNRSHKTMDKIEEVT